MSQLIFRINLYLFIILILAITACKKPSEDSKSIEEQEAQTEARTSKGSNVEALNYEVIEKKDISFAGTPRMTYRIIVNENELPTEARMRKTVAIIWEDGNKHWSEFTVFMYMPGMDTMSVAYGIAEFGRTGLKDFKIQDFALYGTKWRSLEEEARQADAKWKVEKQANEVKEYYINLNLTKKSSRRIVIDIGTNFPEGMNLLIDVSRTYFQKGNPDAYAGEIYSRDVGVANSKIQLAVDIDDTNWFSDFQSKKKQFKELGIYSDIERISQEVEISVMFSPKRKHPSQVLDILGKNAEFVKGAGAKRRGFFTTYSVSKKVSIPFKK